MSDTQDLAPPPGPATFAELRELVGSALSLLRGGEATAAIRAAELSQHALSTIDVPRTSDGAETLNQLGLTLFETGYTRAVEQVYDHALAIAEDLSRPTKCSSRTSSTTSDRFIPTFTTADGLRVARTRGRDAGPPSARHRRAGNHPG